MMKIRIIYMQYSKERLEMGEKPLEYADWLELELQAYMEYYGSNADAG